MAQLAQVRNLYYSCSDIDDGRIEMEILGAEEEDFYYLWLHNGQSSLVAEGLAPGIYQFYIEDSYGCSELYDVEILAIDGCRISHYYRYDPKRCVFEVFVEAFDFDFTPLDENALSIEWDDPSYSGFSFRVPATSSNIELCYDIILESGSGEICCTYGECISMNLPPGQRPCLPGITGCGPIINEFVVAPNGPKYLELLVVSDEECSTDGICDIRKYIIDDNNGEIISKLGLQEQTEVGADLGYIKFRDHSNWSSIPTGSLILLKANDWPNSPENDPFDSNGDGVYVLSLLDTVLLEGFLSVWQEEDGKYLYNGFPSLLDNSFATISNDLDAVQLRNDSSEYIQSIVIGSPVLNDSLSYHHAAIRKMPEYSNAAICLLVDTAFISGESYLCQANQIQELATPGAANNSINNLLIDKYRACSNSNENINLFKINQEGYGKIKLNEQSFVVDLYPVPTMGNVVANVLSDEVGEFVYYVFSTTGKLLDKQEFSMREKGSKEVLIELASIPAGFYKVVVQSPSNKKIVKKVIKF